MRAPNIEGFKGMLSILESTQLSHGKDVLESWGYEVFFENRPKRNGDPDIYLVDAEGRSPKEFLTKKKRRELRNIVRNRTLMDLKLKKAKDIRRAQHES